jgi:hypothetical protein
VGFSIWKTAESWVAKLWAMSGADSTVGRGAAGAEGPSDPKRTAESLNAVRSPGVMSSPGAVGSGRQALSERTAATADPADSGDGYISDIRDLYRKARAYFQGRGGPTSINSDDETVCLILYGVKEFRLAMPDWHWTSLAFQYRVSEHRFTQEFLGTSLTFVENKKEEIETAFDVLDRFARLQLPDKYLDAWDTAHSSPQ